ncbi:unnamed protein product [Effrenium voratum]|uniref:Pentatricopeptide repeat-containing protein, chloroplastic n=1 Tax=Effrenium voratum TaxID=2562239 RepID=A0AA36IDJ6_9DINO|nr:unnamed protein product [Effrenium voratum]
MAAKRLRLNVITYSAAMSVCEMSGLWQLALHLLQECQRAVGANVVACNAAISACEKAGQWKQALLILKRLEESPILPSVISFNAACGACANARRWRAALQTLRRIRGSGLRPNEVSFNTALCCSGWRLVLVLQEMITSEGIRRSALTFETLSASLAPPCVGAVGAWRWAVRLLPQKPSPVMLRYCVGACESAAGTAVPFVAAALARAEAAAVEELQRGDG